MAERSISAYERYGVFVPQADPRLRVHIFNGSETLSGLAHWVYGDWRLWKRLANHNGIRDVRQIAAGTRLFIPPRPVQKGRYGSL